MCMKMCAFRAGKKKKTITVSFITLLYIQDKKGYSAVEGHICPWREIIHHMTGNRCVFQRALSQRGQCWRVTAHSCSIYTESDHSKVEFCLLKTE